MESRMVLWSRGGRCGDEECVVKSRRVLWSRGGFCEVEDVAESRRVL